MDPTLSLASSFPIDFSDLRSLDLIGWDLVQVSAAVPEPDTVALVLLALLVSSFTARRPRSN
jgi:hypothetical protein